MFIKTKDTTNRLIVFGCDILSVALAYALAFALRFDFQWYEPWSSAFWQTLPFLLVIQASAFYFFRLYDALWRYASVTDLISVLKSVLVSQLVMAALILLGRTGPFPRSVLVMEPFLVTAFLCATRLGIRFSRSWRWPNERRPQTPTLIVGEGDLLENTVRVLGQRSDYHVAGIVTEQARWWGRRLHGVLVVGGKKKIPDMIQRHGISTIIVAAPPSRRGAVLGELIALCHKEGAAQVNFKLVPGVQEVLHSSAPMPAIRRVEPSDLLNREAVHMDKASIDSSLRGRRVLVTGAGGTIGSELCRQIVRYGPSRLIVMESSANSLFYLERELAKQGVPLTPLLADVRDAAFVQEVFQHHQPHIVFHAAAHKHVAQLEGNAKEAVKNNIFGTYALARAAQASSVKKFVLISTDKAVRPSSVMGATKNVAEQIVRARAAESRCQFMAVRFGNVLASSGSVVRLFEDQIAKGGPVTVSHPEATRYFMTVQESVQLILQAAVRGRGGEIFILRMGTPVRILDLARRMIMLHGLEPEKDIAIEITGLKSGEKLDEQLIEDEQASRLTEDEQMMVLDPGGVDPQRLEEALNDLRDRLSLESDAPVLDQLRQMVPHYQPTSELAPSRMLV